MRFLHLADLHLGKSVNGFHMIEDQKYILDQILHTISDAHIDGVFICGDVYDRSIPGTEAVELLDDFLTKLKSLRVRVFIISGNHDSSERLGFGGRLFASNGIYIANRLERHIRKETLHDAYGALNIYMLPFIKPMSVKACFQDEAIKTYNDAVKALIGNTHLKLQERNILLAHQFVISGKQKPFISDSEIQLNVGGIDEVDGSCFEDFDYVALGHIHRPQSIGRETMRYAGSILKYSFSEAFQDKYLTVLDVQEKNNIAIEQYPLKPLHDMRCIKGRLKELISDDIVLLADPTDYIHATLTDSAALLEPMKALKSVYPNTMQLAFERGQQGTDTPYLKAQHSVRRKTEAELFADFYEMATGVALDDARLEIVREVVHEAKKIDA